MDPELEREMYMGDAQDYAHKRSLAALVKHAVDDLHWPVKNLDREIPINDIIPRTRCRRCNGSL